MNKVSQKTSGFKAEFFELEGPVSNLDQIDFTGVASHTEALATVSYTKARGSEPFWEGGVNDNFAARISGDLHIEKGGSYTFYLTSDDGSSFSIDGAAVIDNDGLHAARQQTVTLDLQPGVVPFEMLYFERGGLQVLSLEWSGPDTDGERVFLGPEAVSHTTQDDGGTDHGD
ncbi:PA14 domain-containing protein, partial [Roseobacter sp. EG26]|uniref:PA14 domain-containing protein n=1 Tax=Roseobacter sp. EG26 TaxID=3412477 RepID=UPI003CE5B7D4